ncbi:acyltransferase domain-containing protein [Streptomyces sp. NPDC091259]|uniref:acyltransferase domain-containing protein n=1 Tax=Streptomyces sp. NPDC091259 TaxID=3365976 RepID=UPI0037FB1BBC
MTTSTWAVGRATAAADPAGGHHRGRTAFVFSGQGNQWPGMGRDLMALEPSVRQTLEEADGILRGPDGWSLLGELASSRGESRLSDPAVLQPTLVALQIAVARLLAERGVIADAYTGHSLGEIAAAAAAGALGLGDALRLARLRGELMRRAVGTGRTALLGVDAEEAAARIERRGGAADVAAWNAPGSTLVAGDAATVQAVVDELAAREVFARVLPGDIAFHSRFLEPLRAEFQQAAHGVPAGPTSAPLVSTVTGDVVAGTELGAAYWADNLRRPVRFLQAVDTLVGLGCRTFVEIGAHPTLAPSLADCCAARGVEPVVLPTLRRGEDGQENVLRTVWELRAAGVVRPTAAPVVAARDVRFLTAVTRDTERPALRGRAARFAASVAATALEALERTGDGAQPRTARVLWEQDVELAPGEATVVAAPVAPGAAAVAAYGRTPGSGWSRLATARTEPGPLPARPDADVPTAPRTRARTVADPAVEAAWDAADGTLVRLRPAAGDGVGPRALLELALRVAAAVLGMHAPEALYGIEQSATGAAPRWVHVAHGTQAAAAPDDAGAAETAGPAVTVMAASGRPLLRIAGSSWRPAPRERTAPAPSAEQPQAPSAGAGTPHGTGADGADPAAVLAAEPGARAALLTERIRQAAAVILRTGPDRVPADRPLNALGMDSVMGLELRRRLEADYGVEIGLVTVLRGATSADLAADLARQLAEQHATQPAAPAADPVARPDPAQAPTGLPDLDDPADLDRLLADLDALSPEEVDSLLGRLAGDAAGEL